MSEILTNVALCTLPHAEAFALPEGVAGPRAEAIQLVQNKWANGTVLRFHFLASPEWDWPESQKQVVREAFSRWKAVGIGLSFIEAADPAKADLLIGFAQADGSWSWIGTDARKYRDQGRNMNFGWDLSTVWGHATVLHEIGHAIGMPHEHQNPKAGLVWNEAIVYEKYAQSPNFWEPDKTFNNIIRKLSLAEISGSNWDPRSIMHYPFEPGLIDQPAPYDSEGTPANFDLSADDIRWIKTFYPPLSDSQPINAMEIKSLPTGTGAQADFIFEPTATRDYVIQSVGRADVKIIVFTDSDEGPVFLAGRDDSGTPENAKIVIKLQAGIQYTIRVRTHYSDTDEGASLVIV
jgi:Astacin (Peptidase family M12A)